MNFETRPPSYLFDVSQLRGHQQITDLYLAGLAARQGGRLATFDEHIPLGALVNVPPDIVVVIPA
ncbi:MAG: hypothetical protein HUU20_06435 [Pirellulales bacterium]|nr:hypothetical protein [Pirellulales bacterium]